MGNQMVASEIRELFQAPFVQNGIISQVFRWGKLFDFKQQTSEMRLFSNFTSIPFDLLLLPRVTITLIKSATFSNLDAI